MGLNKPLFFNTKAGASLFDAQYPLFVSRLVHFDLGDSIVRRTAVATELRQRFPATIELTLAALLIATVVGVSVGVLAATRRGSWFDTISMLVALVGVSIPIFWLGQMGQFLFGVNHHLLPISLRLAPRLSRGFQSVTGLYLIDGFLRGKPQVSQDAFIHLLLPAFVLATVPLAIIARMTRSAMLEVLNQDYIRTARAKGLRSTVVVVRHALRNALLPVVTVIGLQLGGLLAGAVLTETIFSWPGIGTWIVEAIQGRDYPIVQAGVLYVALVFVLVNLFVDLLYAILDPRISYN
ncbi:MAG: ABC transporter permease [Herpetosiphon sp.]